ncbi:MULTISPECIES: NAD(P)H-dependent glycerol-3-phosphate dehydrogenase [Pandoraea]|jgi:glycerol-3-phosphate dehydrogenase (NAD(P)+)|uniref:Glycerol-3-phosphate dehydrogenase [NAD(P)+] n=1 Tax=Pandoraea pnomenusa TaxID=93220 RepID=A0A378YS21_9BURK|nr:MULTISPECIES: NAD(P)H-dependent glycerol-3-phosphate dehydrogenase [Pandoraea]AHB07566.1 glycerol-3-phosphate dehydrogenase [Pandoraea pnomenusa 3kgm]AHB76241.1 glycerol-3-phosphate dehydrogenase [Pandoraea pnomenusa]AHN75435.1 glycerol-3-phosphate dehydrogenase [Pandoraea pnomenusa]AIU27989.1 glycerol-3-phosphate dehydrogenase [Pandoraea pnomenusa]ANC45131.1 glycerol-3-phosphate dehydrogenase [Pandoraea pnomenusa]
MKIAVFGAGAWGTAMASHMAARHDVVLWARDAALLRQLASAHENSTYLPGCPLSPRLRFEADFATALAHGTGERALCVAAVPVAGLRALAGHMAQAADAPKHLIWLCKGFEADSGLLPHQIVAEVFPKVAGGALSGPSFAREVAQGLPAALTIASAVPSLCELTIAACHFGALRIYSSDDVVGVEVGGAVKNVLAIATGVSDGLGLGLNARAALVTRGLAEMTRLGVALGGKPETFMGLAGMGDLILTATGDLSRNRTVGLQLASGKSLDEVLASLGHVAEGVRCARAVRDLAHAHGVQMPITEAVCATLFDGLPARAAVEALLRRDARAEREDDSHSG